MSVVPATDGTPSVHTVNCPRTWRTMSDLEGTQRRRRITKSIIDTITSPGDRSKQTSIGPSEIANTCNYCVGKALCRKYPELWWEEYSSPWDEGFSLAAWVGTAIHEKLEREHLYGVKESTVAVWELPDYGPISGHVDLIQDDTVIDYKSAWKLNIRDYKLEGPPLKLQYQPHMYGLGVENTGGTVKDVCLFFIPRDSNNISDHWAGFSAYNRKAAERALQRLKNIWRMVQDKKGADLDKAPDCFNCTQSYYLHN